MTRDVIVRLSSNNEYWQADWCDRYGKRFKRSLGRKDKVSKRQAVKLCQNLANEVNAAKPVMNPRSVPTLSQHTEQYVASRSDLTAGTLYLNRLTRKYLLEFFGESVRIDQISRASARDWLEALKAGKFSALGKLAAPTVRGHLINAKAMFRRAVDDDQIVQNPFDRLNVPLPPTDKNWHYVSRAELHKLLAACPSPGWRSLLALCRLAGLRRGEAMMLEWPAIDWKQSRITVTATKTARHGNAKRTVPMQPSLRAILETNYKDASNTSVLVCDISRHCLWRNFSVIRRKAGLPAWADAFQVMRRNCETDWAQRFPQYVVSTWIGHSIEVSAEHYLAVPEELFKRAATE